jgi:malate/lactate dehydrogenase
MRIAVIGTGNVGATLSYAMGQGPDFGFVLLRRG